MKHHGTLEDSDDDDGPQNEDAWLFEDLAVLTRLYSRLKDKDQLISLIFEVSRNLTAYSPAETGSLIAGLNCRPDEGHHNDILLSSSAGL